MNKQILLKSRPIGKPTISNFEIVESPTIEVKEGEIVVKACYISVDPYMRGRMSDAKSYIAPFEVGKPIDGGVIAEVIESKHPNFQVGDAVLASLQWKEIQVVAADKVTKLDKMIAPVSYYLGLLGMPGLTAYFGLQDIGKPIAGETVVVSGAAGAVGLAVGQIAKIQGCRVIGITGSDDKVKLLVEKYGFDEAINYKTTTYMSNAIGTVCTDGVDIYFDNVGGDISDAVINNLNFQARVAICGQISLYNSNTVSVGPRIQPMLLSKSAMMRGFLINNFKSEFPDAMQYLTRWLDEGKLKYTETTFRGFDQLTDAFLGLFNGENVGKMIVKM